MEGVIYWDSIENTNESKYYFEGQDITTLGPAEIMNHLDSWVNNQGDSIDSNVDLKPDHEFAIVIVDINNFQVNLVRDVFGTIPLYYFYNQDCIIFSTNINFILNNKNYNRKPNLNRIHEFLKGISSYISYSEETFFEEIYSVLPGSLLSISKNKKCYKNFFYLKPINQDYFSDSVIKSNFLEILKKSVSNKIFKAKNISTLLSGGIDSSAITCITKTLTDKPLRSIEVRTRFETEDERPFAQAVVDKYHLDHTIIEEFDDFFEREIDFVKTICEPAYFGLSISRHYEISKIVQSNNSDVLLAGMGGDEILGMDNLYFEELFGNKLYKKLNEALNQRSRGFQLSFWIGKIKIAYYQKNYFELINHLWNSKQISNIFIKACKKLFRTKTKKFRNENIIKITAPLVKNPKIEYHYELLNETINKTHFDYIKTILNKSLISYTEHVYHLGKKFNYSYKFPFYDLKLASFIAGCPKEFNFGKGMVRNVLRQSMEGILPDSIRLRKSKTGFNPLVKEITKQKFSEFIDKFNETHLLWTYIDKAAFIELYKAILVDDERVSATNINFCQKVISLGIWLEIFFENSIADDKNLLFG